MANLCAGTPKISVRDNRGLDVRTLRYNRSAAGAVATQYVDAATHNVLGQPATSQDPRFFGSQTLNFQNTPALSGQVLKTVSADAGTSKGCADIAGRPIWGLTQGCNAYTHSNDNITVRMAYDALGRPARRDRITSDVSRGGSAGGTADIWCYGDYSGTPGAIYATADTLDPRNGNQRGRAVQHFDPAGLLDMSILGYALAGMGDDGARAPTLRQDRRFLANVCDPANAWDASDSTPFGKNKAKLESGDPYSTRWTYNALGQILIQSDAKSHQQLTSYDCAGRKYTASVTPQGGALTPVTTSITYTAAGATDTRSDANNIQVAYAYEPQTTQRLVSITALRASTKLQALAYTYDGAGNAIALSDNSASAQVSFFRNRAVTPDRVYTYDALYQLTSATGRENYVNDTPKSTDWPGGTFTPSSTPDYQSYTRTYDYDPGGNLIAIGSSGWNQASPPTRKMVVDSNSNRAVCVANNPSMKPEFVYLQFDPAGKNINVDANAYQPMYWTGLHQLYCVVSTWRLAPGIDNEWASSDREQYAYDGNGQRVRKYVSSMAGSGSGANTWNTADTRYLPGLELRANTATGENLEIIILDDGARVLNWAGGTGKPSDIPNLQLRFQYSDRQNSCQIETDKDGNVITQEECYPYGGTAVLTSRSDSEVKYKYIRYSGKERDATGFYYYGQRYYQPWIGRWINPDPAGTVDGQNLYCMVANNPVTLHDVEGLAHDRPQEEPSTPPKRRRTEPESYGASSSSSSGLNPNPNPSASAGGSASESESATPALPLGPLPKKIHYVWLGGKIPPKRLAEVFLTIDQNPDYDTTMWTDNVRGIASTTDSMTLDETSDARYRYLAHTTASYLQVRHVDELFDRLREVRPSTTTTSDGQPSPGLGTVIASMFYRETAGKYRNYAAASDIARAALMVTEGGVYLDVDVVPLVPFGDLLPPRRFMMPEVDRGALNGVLASDPDSALAGKMLLEMPAQVKRYDYEVSQLVPPGGFNGNNFGPASWWMKRSLLDTGARYRFARLEGTMLTTGPEILRAIGAAYSGSPADFFPRGSLGYRYDDHSELRSMDDAKRLLTALHAREHDPGEIFGRRLRPVLDDSGGWSTSFGNRRSSV